MEIFDLTQDDSPEEQQETESNDEGVRLTVYAVTEIVETYEVADDEEIFFECCTGEEDDEPRLHLMGRQVL